MPSLGATCRPQAGLCRGSLSESYPAPNMGPDSATPMAPDRSCINCYYSQAGPGLASARGPHVDDHDDDLIGRPLLLDFDKKQSGLSNSIEGAHYHNQVSYNTTATSNTNATANNKSNNNNHHNNNNHYRTLTDDSYSKPNGCCGGKFRYLVVTIILCAVAMNSYANYTMYIAAIEMVSNDVLASGMTGLRAKHLSQDPLAISLDAATPGTCPIETSNLEAINELKRLSSTYVSLAGGNQLEANESMSTSATKQHFNATAISEHEQRALAADTLALYVDINERIASGQLVDWSIGERGLVFTAHTIGTILISVPVARLGLVYGSKRMVSFCVLIAAGRMLLLPLAAGRLPMWLFLLFELIMGAPGPCIGILGYPLAAAWLLPEEANFFVALGQFAGLIGNAATNFISTQLLALKIDWSYCYYLPGACLTLIGLLWMIFGADRPQTSRFVSRDELNLLNNSLVNRNKQNQDKQQLLQVSSDAGGRPSGASYLLIGQQVCRCCANCRPTCPALHSERKPNWSIIFTCPTIWSLIAVNFAYHWNAKIATLWPTFFANNLHLDPTSIGILTGLKGVVALILGSAFAFLTRSLAIQRPFRITLTAYRRLNQVFATLFLAASVALMTLWDCDVWANFASVMLTPLVSSFNAISHEQMPLDLSAEDSGLLVSVIRMLAVGDIPALPASSWILSYAPDGLAGDRFTWRLVWLVGLIVKVGACLMFVFVARSQPKSYTRLEPGGPCQTITRERDQQQQQWQPQQ